MLHSSEVRLSAEEQCPPDPDMAGQDEAVYVLPASINQQSLWFLDKLTPGQAIYNIAQSYQLDGPLHPELLEASLNYLIQRHEALRTTFALENGEPVQIVHARLPLTLHVHPPVSQAEITRFVAAKSNQPFDLGSGPLIRADLLPLGEQLHLLVLVVHHIVFDYWSAELFINELATVYSALYNHHEPALPELPLQYADFAAWQLELLAENAMAGQVEYWREHLKDAPALTELPTDYPRSPRQGFEGQSYAFTLPLNLSAALQQFSRANNVTLYTTLLSAFNILLYRYSQQSDIVLGSPVAGRDQEELHGVIGYFVNMLVLRSRLSAEMTFVELLQQLHRSLLDAHSNASLPFERLVTLLKTERTPGYNPVFQITFNFLADNTDVVEFAGLTLSAFEAADTTTTKFDLSLALSQHADGLKGDFTYNVALFKPQTIERMAGHLQTILAAIVSQPHTPIARLPLLTAAEYQQLVTDWNQTARAVDASLLVHQLFEQHARKQPQASALRFENHNLNYQQLNEQANQLAHHLQTLGVGPEVLVGVYFERSLEMIVALLSILKAGGAFVPLDPLYPPDRLAFMVADAGLNIVLTQKHLRAALPPAVTHVLCLDDKLAELTRPHPTTTPLSDVDGANLAYVIYTSGSTGKPKGVGIEHRQILNYTLAIIERFNIVPRSRFATVSTLAADLGNTAIYPALCTGGELHVLSWDRATSAQAFAAYLAQYPIDYLKIVPSHFAALQKNTSLQQILPQRGLIFGGEAAQADWVESLLRANPPCTIFNHYGPTETTVGVLTYQCNLAYWPLVTPVLPLGRPLANTQIYLLDAHQQPVPVGIPGEVYIGGANVARGYLNRPDLTAERFVNASGQINGRLYKTGDLARYLPDGNIEFLGRSDNQVKIRGFRIELGEIEDVLHAHPGIKQAVVTVYQSGDEDKRLVAYWLPAPGATPNPANLKQFMQAKLPQYMLPSSFIQLEQFPLTPNGKIDHRALPAPEAIQTRPAKTFAAPQTDLQWQLARIWERVLGVKPIGLHDNFFDLGGHSLLAVRLFAQMSQVFGRDLPLATLFQAPTIAQLSSVLSDANWTPPWASLVPLQPQGTRQPFFCVHAVGGNVLSLRDLARHLGPEQPFYALQSQGLNGKEKPPASVPETAASYIQEICTIQPEGPYLLSGQSSGGVIAFEMARQLKAAGQEVALLAMIDTYPPMAAATQAPVTLRQKVDMHWQAASHFGLQYLFRQSMARYRRERRRLERGLIAVVGKFYQGRQRPLPHALRYISVREAILRAIKSYQPQLYHGEITLFQASATVDSFMDANNSNEYYWQLITTQPLVVHNIYGTHNLEQEPFVGELAARLTECLSKV